MKKFTYPAPEDPANLVITFFSITNPGTQQETRTLAQYNCTTGKQMKVDGIANEHFGIYQM
ncbi:MAG: hypothetical protein JW754_05850 [Candidatus Aenigmarchaeota archaeon]|nr:hypothetical protein [Candidatus Aenigmarchaeota archaeon]